MTFNASAAISGVTLGVAILYLVRVDRLYVRDALFWLLMALASIWFAIWPRLLDVIGIAAGVADPPVLILALVCAALTVKGLAADIAITQLRREMRRLNQRVALMDQRD